MPIYEYKCKKCSHFFEKLVLKIGDQEIVCPKCNNKKVEKLLSSPNFKSNSGISPCTTTNNLKGFT